MKQIAVVPRRLARRAGPISAPRVPIAGGKVVIATTLFVWPSKPVSASCAPSAGTSDSVPSEGGGRVMPPQDAPTLVSRRRPGRALGRAGERRGRYRP